MGIENKVILVEQGKVGKWLIDSWMRLLYKYKWFKTSLPLVRVLIKIAETLKIVE